MATPAAVLSIIVEAQTGKAKAELERFNRTLGDKKVEVKVDFDKSSAAKAQSAMAVLTKESNKMGDVFNRSQLSIGQWTGILAASLPVVVDLGAAIGALTASAAEASLGIGALAVGAGGAGLVGIAGIAAVAVPAIANLGDLKTAQDAYTEAVERYGKESTQAATAFTKLAFEQKKAGPLASKFAAQLSTMTQRWRQLTKAGQADFIGLLSEGVNRLNKRLPLLAKSANASMRALRVGFDRFLDKATGPEFNHFIKVMTQTFAKSVKPLGAAFGNIAKVLQRIATAVAPDIVRMARGFRDMTEGWVDSTRNAKDLRETIHGLVNQANTWWKLIKAVGNLFVAVLAPGAEKGKQAIEGITATIKDWTNWVNAHPKEMRDFFKEGLKTTEELAKALLSFLPNLIQISTAMRPIARAFLIITTGLNSLKVGNISALTVLFGLIIGTKLVKGVLGVAGAFGNVVTGIAGATKAAGGFSGVMQTLALKGMYAKEAIANWSATMLTGIKDTLGKIRERMTRSGKASGMTWGKGFGRAAAVGIAIGIVALGPMIQDKVEGIFGDARKGMRDKLLDPFGQSLIQSWKGFTDSIGKSWRNLKQLIGNQVKAIRGHVGSVVDAFDLFLNPIKSAIRLVGRLIRKIKDLPSPGDFLPDLPGGGKGGLLGTGIGNNPFNAKGGFVTPQGVVPFQGFAAGGMVGGLRPKGTDTVPAMLTPGEMVLPKHVVDSTRKNAKLTAAAMTGELGKGYKKARKDSEEFEKGHKKTLDRLRDTAKKLTGSFKKTTVDDFQKTGKEADDSTDKMRSKVTDGFQKTKSNTMEATQAMKQGVSEDFRNLTSAVGDGINKIAKMTNTALKALGVKKVDFTVSTKDPKGHQRGGPIGGKGVGDTVPAMLEPGEFVVNSKAAAKHRDALAHINFKDAPRFKKGGPVGGGMATMISEANKFEQRGFPYAWGGGHGGFGIQPVDCSGAVSDVLHVAGLLDAPLTSGGLMNWGKAGKGPLTVYSNPHHVVMSLNGRVFGTSGSNPGGGAGWIEGARGESLAPGAVRTMDVVGGAIAKGVKEVLLKGPKGPLKDMGQAALDKVRGAANRYIEKKTPSGAFGGGQASIYKGALDKIFPTPGPQIAPWQAAMLAERVGLPGITYAQIAKGESDYRPGAVSSDGGYGLWQMTPRVQSAATVRAWENIGSYFNPWNNAQMAKVLAGGGTGTSNYFGVSAVTDWNKHWHGEKNFQKGGMVEPFVGNFAKGGTVGRDGVAKVHKGEQILPKPELGGMKQMLRFLRSLADSKRERRLIRHIRDSSGNRQLKLLNKALTKMRVNFTNAERKRLRVLARDQRHGGGLTHEEKRELHKLRRERRKEAKENDIKDQVAVQREMLVEWKALRKELKEHNRLVKDVRMNEKAALTVLGNLMAAQIGAQGLQKRRLASAGSAARY